jgi:predicted transposase YbfD/YdcC
MKDLTEKDIPQLIEHFQELDDPRIERCKKHLLLDIVVIAICAVIGGAENFVEIATFGRAKRDWFQRFLLLPEGIPSHDTFNRVFAKLTPSSWQTCFMKWAQSVVVPDLAEGQDYQVCIDGKTARRSGGVGLEAVHMVTAWASHTEIVLGQQAVAEKSNEITAIPVLVETLEVAGAVVSIDAMGTQKDIAWRIREHHADYVLALKDNHPKLYEDVLWLFDPAQRLNWHSLDYDYCESTEQGHGRFEQRRCWVLRDLSYLAEHRGWRDLSSVAMVEATRIIRGIATIEKRYYLSSLPPNAERIAKAVRTHWHVENSLHWILDVAFREDDSRIREGHAQTNFIVLRHLALSLLRQDKASNIGIKAKRLRAGWDTAYLEAILGMAS